MQPDQPVQTPPLTQPQMSTQQLPPSPQPALIPPIPTEVPKKSSPMLKVLIILVVIGLIGGVGIFAYKNYVSNQQTKDLNNTPVATPTPNPDPMASSVERKFEKLELTFKAPQDLTMEELEEIPGQIVAYIQNNKTGDEFFQMYFMYQKSGKKVSQSDIQTFKNDPKLIIPGTARDVSIDGYSGFAGQVNDSGKRFITAIVKNGYWLIIYIAEPTQTNKELSDRIMSTFKFTD